jgi:hypothetical protein
MPDTVRMMRHVTRTADRRNEYGCRYLEERITLKTRCSRVDNITPEQIYWEGVG